MVMNEMTRIGERRGLPIYCSITETSNSWSALVQVRQSDEDGTAIHFARSLDYPKFGNGALSVGLHLLAEAEQFIEGLQQPERP